MSEQGKFAQLYDAFKAGQISRRQFIHRAGALGVVTSGAILCANFAEAAASGGSLGNGFAFYARNQDGTASAAPSVGTENQERGAGGDLRLIQWQAATMAAPHSAVGTKDFLASVLVVEPLLHYLPDGSLIPCLVSEVPSVENGGLAEDLSSITFRLLEGVTWSDGEPFTANDVVFTWQWIITESNASVSYQTWFDWVEQIEATDDLTAVVTLKQPTVAWFDPFAGGVNGPIYPAHIFNNDPTNRNDAFLTAPVGTGPFVIESFQPNAEAVYAMNENYREPNKPFFSRVILTGGGDAAAAARAVVQTGEYDYAWNIQVEPQILEEMEASGEAGHMLTFPSTDLERININFSDPNTEVEGQRSHVGTPHPILSDLAVRQALNLAVPREVIATEFYGEGQPATADLLNGIPPLDSPNTSWEFNLERAAALLDEAGWVMEGDVRVKDGVEFQLSYATSINQARQKTQAVVQQAFEQLGIRVQLQQVDAGIYFDSAAGNEQNISHFYWDLDMYTNGPGSLLPITYMLGWYAGPDARNIAQQENDWSGQNYHRWQNDEYDQLYTELTASTDPEQAVEIFIQMNDIVINDVVMIPEVNRGDVQAVANTLNEENLATTAFELDYWNIANWNRVQ